MTAIFENPTRPLLAESLAREAGNLLVATENCEMTLDERWTAVADFQEAFGTLAGGGA